MHTYIHTYIHTDKGEKGSSDDVSGDETIHTHTYIHTYIHADKGEKESSDDDSDDETIESIVLPDRVRKNALNLARKVKARKTKKAKKNPAKVCGKETFLCPSFSSDVTKDILCPSFSSDVTKRHFCVHLSLQM